MPDTYVLGVSAHYHDSAACLLKNGEVVAAAQQERFSRKKHDNGFPKEAIEYCLSEADIVPARVDYIGFYEKPFLKFERLLYQMIDTFPWSAHAFIDSLPSWLSEKLAIPSTIEGHGFKAKTFFVEHHRSHAAGTYLASPFDSAAILTMDGVGEWATTTMGEGKDNTITLSKEIHFPHSVGLLYSAITAYLGFSVNNSEYKVMGLAPYGKNSYQKEFDELMQVFADGSFALNMKYFSFHHAKSMFSPEMESLFGQPPRKKESAVTEFHQDMAASLQAKTEEVILGLLNHLYQETKQQNVCLSGGVALNSVANGKILRRTPFKRLFIQPAAGDAGSAMGAALYVHNVVLGNAHRFRMKHAYWGPGFGDVEIRRFLDEKKINYQSFDSHHALSKKVAELVWDNQVVGWFQGRMEWGPRALGARSILSNPCNPEMQNILNLRVKHRERFRPFAPVIAEESINDWFEADTPTPDPTDYMLMVYPIKKAKQKKIPAVTHVDGSGRLQTVRKGQNPNYYSVIKEFEKLSGVPILINTSFNIRGEPIVCTPAQAYRCMMGTGIDYLAMGSFLIPRKENLRDAWDSESIAMD